ncbi:hypothetical protein CYMTET_24045, partial [Cymbomonas tetramitiformis]
TRLEELEHRALQSKQELQRSQSKGRSELDVFQQEKHALTIKINELERRVQVQTQANEAMLRQKDDRLLHLEEEKVALTVQAEQATLRWQQAMRDVEATSSATQEHQRLQAAAQRNRQELVKAQTQVEELQAQVGEHSRMYDTLLGKREQELKAHQERERMHVRTSELEARCEMQEAEKDVLLAQVQQATMNDAELTPREAAGGLLPPDQDEEYRMQVNELQELLQERDEQVEAQAKDVEELTAKLADSQIAMWQAEKRAAQARAESTSARPASPRPVSRAPSPQNSARGRAPANTYAHFATATPTNHLGAAEELEPINFSASAPRIMQPWAPAATPTVAPPWAEATSTAPSSARASLQAAWAASSGRLAGGGVANTPYQRAHHMGGAATGQAAAGGAPGTSRGRTRPTDLLPRFEQGVQLTARPRVPVTEEQVEEIAVEVPQAEAEVPLVGPSVHNSTAAAAVEAAALRAERAKEAARNAHQHVLRASEAARLAASKRQAATAAHLHRSRDRDRDSKVDVHEDLAIYGSSFSTPREMRRDIASSSDVADSGTYLAASLAAAAAGVWLNSNGGGRNLNSNLKNSTDSEPNYRQLLFEIFGTGLG